MTFHTNVRLVSGVVDDKLKVAVNRDDQLSFFFPQVIIDQDSRSQFITMPQDKSLDEIVVHVAGKWNLSECQRFALMFSQDGSIGNKYVTEQNRYKVEKGSILVFSTTAECACEVFLAQLGSECGVSDDARISCLDKMRARLGDAHLAQAAVNAQLLPVLTNMVVDNKQSDSKLMKKVLDCLLLLMGHQIVSWDSLDTSLVMAVAAYVTGKAKCEDIKTVTVALDLLVQIVNHSEKLVNVVQEEVPFETLIRQLETHDTEKQKNTLALMNGLFAKADIPQKHDIFKLLTGNPVRKALENNMLQRGMPSGDLRLQLAIMQHLILRMAHYRLMTHPNESQLDEASRIDDLVNLTFENPSEKADSLHKLGFQNCEEPVKDFDYTPPGMMALDCLLFMAKEHTDEFQRMVVESVCRADDHRLPLVTVAVPLVKLLAVLLGITNDAVIESQLPLYPMFFKTEKPLEEMFCTCLVLFGRTWKEMNATLEDLDKVLDIVGQQITCSLKCLPSTFGRLREEMTRFSYAEIQRLWERERAASEETFIKSKKVLDIQEKIKPELEALVKANRLNVLKRGIVLPKVGRGKESKKINLEKGKYWFWKLSANEKVLMFEDCDEKTIPKTDELKEKIAVADLATILTGKDCPHFKDAKNFTKKGVSGVCFTLVKQNDDNDWFNFVIEEQIYHSWMDGLRVLLGLALDSEGAKRELDILVDLELRIHLLEFDHEIDNVQQGKLDV